MKINLLPEEARRSKNVRCATIFLAAVQAVVLFGTILLYALVAGQNADVRLDLESKRLEVDMLAAKRLENEPAGTLTGTWHEAFLTSEALAKATSLPERTKLESISFSQGDFTVTSSAASVIDVWRHMEMARASFASVILSRFEGKADGTVRYELVIIGEGNE